MKIKLKILLLVVLPILIMGVLIVLLSSSKIQSAMESENSDGMEAVAISVYNTYSNASGSFWVDERGDFKKGNQMNISKKTDIVDSVKDTGMEVAVFYGSDLKVTSLTDKHGARVEALGLPSSAATTTLGSGEPLFTNSLNLDGVIYSAYYYPIINAPGEAPLGVIMILRAKAELNEQIWSVQQTIIMIALIVAVACIFLAYILVHLIVKALNHGVDVLNELKDGNLSVDVPEKLTKRRDEIGDMGRSVSQLKEQLVTIISQLKDHSEALSEAADRLKHSAINSSDMMRHVESAFTDIASGAQAQSRETQTATETVSAMGTMVDETSSKAVSLNENADHMKAAGAKAMDTLSELSTINERTKNAIDTIYEQTNQTNSSVGQIREATELITSIADETSLLSLNASIEAARAGEAGRGFAVVAGQIQKLSELTNESVKKIDVIVENLIANSSLAVNTMNEVNVIMDQQSEHVQKTNDIFVEVRQGIDTSIDEISEIYEKTKMLHTLRNDVVSSVDSLTSIADQNTSATEATSESTQQVTATMTEIESDADSLASIASELLGVIERFKL